MRILRAAHLGMCFGVRDAIALALEHADGTLTILGDLVHNPTILSALEAKGIAVVHDAAQVKTPTRATNLIRDRGITQMQFAQAEAICSAARAFLWETATRLWEKTSTGQPAFAPSKPDGPTPMIVNGIPFSLRTVPTHLGSAPNRRCQNESLRTTTGFLPGATSSSARKKRPT